MENNNETKMVYMIKGEDGNTYGVFLNKQQAEIFQTNLSKEYGNCFFLDSFDIGPTFGYEQFLNR